MTTYSENDGLVNNAVRAIFQDSKGFLWISTWEGLSKYDGHRFTNFTESNGLSHNLVNDVVETKTGDTYVAMNNGSVDIICNDQVTQKGVLKNIVINKLQLTQEGKLLALTDNNGIKGSAGTVTGWPFAPLVVENSAQCYINLLAPDDLESGIFFGKPESNISGGIIYNNTLSGANSLQFRTGGNQIRMIIDANGNAAVGTTATNNYRLKVSHALAGLAIENNSTSAHWELYTSANDGPGNLELFTQASLRGSFNASTGAYSALPMKDSKPIFTL